MYLFTDVNSMGVKSLEQIQREKAIESMRRNMLRKQREAAAAAKAAGLATAATAATGKCCCTKVYLQYV